MSDPILERLINMTDGHERRLNQFDVWKSEISGKLDNFSNSIKKIEDWQQQTCKQMVETKKEVMMNITQLSTSHKENSDKLTETLTKIRLENAEEKGRREQSNKNLYLLISVMGLLPMIVSGIGMLIFYFSGHKING